MAERLNKFFGKRKVGSMASLCVLHHADMAGAVPVDNIMDVSCVVSHCRGGNPKVTLFLPETPAGYAKTEAGVHDFKNAHEILVDLLQPRGRAIRTPDQLWMRSDDDDDRWIEVWPNDGDRGRDSTSRIRHSVLEGGIKAAFSSGDVKRAAAAAGKKRRRCRHLADSDSSSESNSESEGLF